MHITGGAFTKLKDLLPGADARVTRDHGLEPHPIFRELHQEGVGDQEMYKTFNCGVGFVLGVPQQQASACVDTIKKAGFESDVVGEVVKGEGRVHVASKFSDADLTY